MQAHRSLPKALAALALLLVFAYSGVAGELPLSEFQLITMNEETIFGERIKFFSGDTLYGWLHSNDQIALMMSPIFYGPVTTSASTFWQGSGYDPIFYQDPIFNYPEAEFPQNLDELRLAAMGPDHYFDIPGFQYRMVFIGVQGVNVYGWEEGIPFNDSLIYSTPPPTNTVFFFEGNLEMLATDPENHNDRGIAGRYTVGCSNDIYLLDNLRFVDSNIYTGEVDVNTNNCLGVAAEGNVLIKNTPENGKDNGGNLYPNDPWRSDIIFNGAVLALGESFSFEDQNDDTTFMGGTLPEWYYSYGTSPDERGEIWFWGSMAQYRRGYTHRSNHGGTGYIKKYNYFTKLYLFPPPYWPSLPVELMFEPAEIEFGQVEVGDTAEAVLTLKMETMDTVNIEDWEYSDPVFYGDPETLLYTPIDSSEMTVYFAPTNNSEYNGTLTLETNAGNYVIPLSGEGYGLGAEGQSVAELRKFELIGATPNPFNNSVRIDFYLRQSGKVALEVFDLAGRRVYSLQRGGVPGKNSLKWAPEGLSSGIYLYKIQNQNSTFAGKVIYLK